MQFIQSLGVGELILTSIDKDGTGQGYELSVYEEVSAIVDIPIIASGGVGKFDHFTAGLALPQISAANSANIFNFMVNGLIDARKYIEDQGIPLAHWTLNEL